MNIVFSKTYSNKQNYSVIPNNTYKSVSFQNKISNDIFVKNKETNTENKKKKKLLIGITSAATAIVIGGIIKKHITAKNMQGITPFMQELAESLSVIEKHKIKPQCLKSVISGKELETELRQLKPENFVASEENIKNGTFLADLHSHSTYSDGKGKVVEILEQVANYADHVNKKTGRKFIYALTDHDTADGVKEALKIISSDPDKYKNVKFATGAEISYIIRSDKTTNPFETSEILVYGFNPFSKKAENFFKGLKEKRETKTMEFIDDLKRMFGYADFSVEEFRLVFGNKNPMMNHPWKVHHYGQTKNAVAGLANSQRKDKSKMYREIMSKTDEHHMALGHLRDRGLVPKSYGDDSNITRICQNKYLPHNTPQGIDYGSENSFESIIEAFGENDNFLALAHPYYITERNSDSINLIKSLVSKSKGYLKGSESFHQAYNPTVKMSSVERFNKHIVSDNNFLELGGRDNHEANWLSIEY